ncbi:MAG: response regulator [Isosphaeraceae bacterium]|jgi:response regulator NasT
MTAALSIAVADDEPRMRDYYCSTLQLMGHRVVVVARDGCEMVEGCRNTRPDLIITDIKMPDMDGIDAAREICGGEPIPIILVSAYHDADLLDRAGREHILAYLVKPIKQADLEAAISIAMQRFEEFRALRKEAGELRGALEDRKVIERAKGILMKKTGLDEPEVFRRLQKLSRDQNRKMVEVARMILRADEAFRPV